METTDLKRGYHHGHLREALIEAAVDLVAEQDIGAVSLRAVARRAGVTNAAPYHHFKDKRALLAAVAAEGFRVLQDAVLAAHAEVANATPEEQLEQLGMAYITFAISHPAHYQVMFRTDLHGGGEPDEVLEQRAMGTFEFLMERVAAMVPGGGSVEDPRVRQQAVLCWSTVHGFASLWIQGAMGTKIQVDDWRPVAEHVLQQVGCRVHDSFNA